MATEAQRQHVLALIDWHVAHASQLDYPPQDLRDSRDLTSWNLTEQQADHVIADGGRLQFDCSEDDAWILKCAGLWHWKDPGYTGSHLATMPTYLNGRVARVGALVVFGPGDGHHEGIVHTPDPVHGNPLIGSHGAPGYRLLTVAEEESYQTAAGHPGVRYLSIAHL